MNAFLRSLTSRRMACVLLFGFFSGFPLGLTGSTLQAWMATEGVDLKVIGMFSLVGMPYTLKFLWAPLMDRYVPSFLGRRRGWIFLMQVGLALSIALMAFSDPKNSPAILALMALLVAFFSASQDIVVDAYKAEILEPKELGPGAGNYYLGYRVAMVVSGAIALILADHLPWRTVYLLMGAIMGAGTLATLWAPEPQVEVKTPKSLNDAVVLPFIEFFSRKGALEILGFIVLYKLDVVVTLALTTPFLLDIGFSKTDIGTVTKGFGLFATIFGSVAGGAVMMTLGMKRSLWLFGILQGVSGLSFAYLAHMGHHYPLMVTAIALENLCSGMGNSAYLGFLMSLCDKRFAATQYALLSSLMALTRVLAGAPTGYLAANYGWVQYFIISTLLMIPGLIFLIRYDKWTLPNKA